MSVRIAVDFDDTIAITDDDGLHLIDGAKEQLQNLHAQGYEIIIYTCRITLALEDGNLDQELRFIESFLEDHEIPFDAIFTGPKLIADFYVDDRSVEFEGNWSETGRKLQEKATKLLKAG